MFGNSVNTVELVAIQPMKGSLGYHALNDENKSSQETDAAIQNECEDHACY